MRNFYDFDMVPLGTEVLMSPLNWESTNDTKVAILEHRLLTLSLIGSQTMIISRDAGILL